MNPSQRIIGRTLEIGKTKVPSFFYGTAWKEQRTADLVTRALRAGFRAVDTANQRRHYHEAEAGEALAAEFERFVVWREDVFIQTKFTFAPAQDYRLPYDPAAPISRQVVQSFESSLQHLKVEKLDSLLMHAPSQRWTLGPADREAWEAMEGLHDEGKVKFIGVSNFSSDQLKTLIRSARIRPAFVQNRCFASLGWDAAVRRICDAEGVVLQAFSLLTANVDAVHSPVVQNIALGHGRTPAQVIFRFALQLGMIPLTGTSDPRHMEEDLAVYEFELSPEEVQAIERIAG